MKEGIKNFINQSGKDLTITLFIREGDPPDDEGGRLVVIVPKDGKLEVVYTGEPGSEGLVFLNGLLFEWQEGGDMVGVSQRVVTRGDAWDNTLNTNNTITIGALAAGQLTATGSNT